MVESGLSIGICIAILSGMCTRPSELRPRQDVAASEMLAKNLSSRDSQESRELQRLAKTFCMTYGERHWQWKKLYRL